MKLPFVRSVILALVGVFFAVPIATAQHTYTVNGPIVALDANTITVTQGTGTEKFVIRREGTTQLAPGLKVGDIVHVVYYMTATGISPKGAAKVGSPNMKTYKVGGPVVNSDSGSITLTQGTGTEKYVIARAPGTQVSGPLTPGEQVRVDYYMTASSVGLHAPGQPAPPGPRSVAPVPAPVAAGVPLPNTAPVAPRSVILPPATAPRTTVSVPPATHSAAPASGPVATAAPVPDSTPVKKSRRSKKAAQTEESAATPPPEATPVAVSKKSRTQAQGETAAAAPVSDAAASPTSTPAKKTRKSKRAAAATQPAPDAVATPAVTPAKKTRATKKAAAADAAAQSPDATTTPTPAKKTRKSKKKAAAEAAEAAPTPTPAKP